ncbi:MAG: ferredoxin family protein [Candidatus Thorarchaeota archaeon]
MTITVQERRTDLLYNPLACNRCGLCLEVCPFNVWELPEKGPAIMARPDDCTNCTACAKNCLGNAITVTNVGCGCIWNQSARRRGECEDTVVGAKEQPESSDSDSSCGCSSTKSSCCG